MVTVAFDEAADSTSPSAGHARPTTSAVILGLPRGTVIGLDLLTLSLKSPSKTQSLGKSGALGDNLGSTALSAPSSTSVTKVSTDTSKDPESSPECSNPSPSSSFHAFAHLPPGPHFLSAGLSSFLAGRTGFWFIAGKSASDVDDKTQDGRSGRGSAQGANLDSSEEVYIWRWDNALEELQPVTDPSLQCEWQQRLQRIAARTSDQLQVDGGIYLPYKKLAQTNESTRNAKVSGPQPQDEDSRRSRNARIQDSSGDTTSQNNAAGPDLEDWPALTSEITPAVLNRLTGVSRTLHPETETIPANISPRQTWALSTASCAVEDREEIPGINGSDFDDRAEKDNILKSLGIDLRRTWREGAIGAERTEQARDRSWALEHLVETTNSTQSEAHPIQSLQGDVKDEAAHSWGRTILGTMQTCFLAVLILSNHSCLEEWKRILTLVLTSDAAVDRHPDFFVAFLQLLLLQLQHCADAEGGLLDVSEAGSEGDFLRDLLRRFRKRLGERMQTSQDSQQSTPGVERSAGDKSSASNTTSAADGGSPSSIAEVGEAFEELEEWVQSEWNWQLGDNFLRRGMLELEDGETVEVETTDMADEDERGEYAPVIVEL